MNTQVQPTIQEIRHSLCSQLIGAGVTQPEAIVSTAKAIEAFVYSEITPYVPEAKVSSAVSEEKAVKKIEEIQKAETTEQPAIEPADIKSALLRVSIADRKAFKAIMAQFNVTVVSAIEVTDFPAVMAEVEKFEAENA